MSAVYGVDTSYSAVKDIHYDLNLAGTDELTYYTGNSTDPNSKNPMRPWSQFIRNILFDEKLLPPPSQAEKIVEHAVAKDTNGMSLYDIIKAHPKLTKFRKLIDEVSYGKYFSDDITIFAPIDDVFDEVLEYPLKIAYRKVAALQVLRYHILPYVIKPWQMEGRKLRLNTDLGKDGSPTATIDVHWMRGDTPTIMNPIETKYLPEPIGTYTNPTRISGDYAPSYEGGSADPYNSRQDVWFPKFEWQVPVIQSIQGLNGMLYIISRPLSSSDLF